MSFTVLLAKNNLLIDTRLDLLVEIRPRAPQHEPILPFLADKTEFPQQTLL